MKDLTGKVAVVTGAGSGIGRAIAVALAEAGCVVAAVDIDLDSADAVASEINDSGGVSSPHRADVAEEASIESLVAEVVETHGAVNVLVNNAGVVALGYFEDLSLDDFAWVTNINAWGVIFGTKHFLPHMPDGEGHVVNIVSAAGIYAEPGRTAYAFTKFGVRGFTEALRLELRARGIGVSAVYPGIISTNIEASTRRSSSRSSSSASGPPVKAHPPEEVAEKVVSAIRRNRARTLVGGETHLLDIGSRLFPSLFPKLVQRLTKT